jgi:hypothetical protein
MLLNSGVRRANDICVGFSECKLNLNEGGEILEPIKLY